MTGVQTCALPICCLAEPLAASHIETTRWAMMLSLSLEVRGWLIGTRNRSEDVLGTYSLASRTATLLPIVGLWKSEVMALAQSVNIPTEILISSQRADPSCGRPQAMADITFEVVDRFLQVRQGERAAAELEQIPAATIQYLDSVYQRNQFKRNFPLRAPQLS